MPTEKALNATPPTKSDLNLEIRRNFYDQSGKDVVAALKEKQANGEDSGTNGTSSAEAAIKTLENVAKEPKKPVNCNSCGVDCTRVHYRYAKSAANATGSNAAKIRYDLCPNCFMEARHPQTHQNIEFVKLEDANYTSVPDRDAPWTDAELLLLLEGLELFDEKWESIAEHVGTRTREECVVKFLQLEIEDKYMVGESDGSTNYGPLNQGRIPFTQADNPVLSVLGFLATLADPSVAAAAANRSVGEMRRLLRNQIENGVPASRAEDTNTEKSSTIKPEDSMEVDNITSSHPANPRSESQKSSHDITAPALALATSAARAHALASHEERELTRIVSAAQNNLAAKFEFKLQQFSTIEAVVAAERRELDKGRQQLFLDRVAFRKRVREAEEMMSRLGIGGGADMGKVGEKLIWDGRAAGEVAPLSEDGGGVTWEI